MSELARPVLNLSVTLGEDVKAYRLVTLAGATPSSSGDPVVGATVREGDSGDLLPVTVLGTATVEAGAAVTRGAEVQANADGKAIAQAGSGSVAGIALEAASADGDKIEVFIQPKGT